MIPLKYLSNEASQFETPGESHLNIRHSIEPTKVALFLWATSLGKILIVEKLEKVSYYSRELVLYRGGNSCCVCIMFRHSNT